MNKDYIPMFGEASDSEKKFVLNIISLKDLEIEIKYQTADGRFFIEKVVLQKNTCTKKIYTYDVKKLFIEENCFSFNFTDKWKFNFINCDCHFVPESGMIENVPLGMDTITFHLGDQIYLDLLFMDVISSSYTEEEIRSKIYSEYVKAFLRKKDVLQKSFNIMLGDDHEIADETLRDPNKELEAALFKTIFEEIQEGLRLNKLPIVHYDDSSFILVNNINTMGFQEYLNYIHEIILGDIFDTPNFRGKTYLLSPRNLLNTKNSTISNIIFSSEDNNHNFSDFFNFLFEKFGNGITILCGDEHTAAKFTISNLNNRMDFYFVGPINSVPDPLKNKFQLNNIIFDVKEEYLEQSHSFITINGDKIVHERSNSCCINFLGSLSYSTKFAYYRMKYRLNKCFLA